MLVSSGGSWLLLMVGPAKQLLKCQSSIRRLPKFKGGVNKFLAKNAIFAIAISIL